MKLPLPAYDDFGKFRMEDFFPPGTEIWEETGVECGIGYGNGQAVGFSAFLWKPSMPGVVAEIRLESLLAEDCPPDVSEAIFEKLNLPIRAFMNQSQVTALLGAPAYTGDVFEGQQLLEFVCGDKWTYRISCFFNEQGLYELLIARNDLWNPA